MPHAAPFPQVRGSEEQKTLGNISAPDVIWTRLALGGVFAKPRASSDHSETSYQLSVQ